MKVVQFPKPKPQSQPKAIRSADGIKYFREDQIRLLRRSVRDAADRAARKKQCTAIRDWALIDLLTSTGLRAHEAAGLRCGDIDCGNGQSELFVRCGKGHVSRTIQIPASLKAHLKQFLKWKEERGEGIKYDDHVFVGQRGPLCPWAISARVKRWLRRLNLYAKGKAAHSLRHSYGTQLYRREHDLRAVQKQLGHSRIQTSQIYADCLPEDIQRQIFGLWATK